MLVSALVWVLKLEALVVPVALAVLVVLERAVPDLAVP